MLEIWSGLWWKIISVTKLFMPCLELLPTLLESCPNQNSLVLVLVMTFTSQRLQRNLFSLYSFIISPWYVVFYLGFLFSGWESGGDKTFISTSVFAVITGVCIKRFNGGPAKMEVLCRELTESRVLKKRFLDIGCSNAKKGVSHHRRRVLHVEGSPCVAHAI